MLSTTCNAEYRGKWVPPIIDNPAYIGEWAPKKIPNPNYFEDPHPSRLAPIGAVAIEVWTTNPGFHYDNIIVAKNLDDAWAFADASFVKKQDAEEKKQEEDVAVKLAESERQRMLSGGFKEVVAVYVQKFVTYVAGNRHMTEFFDRVLKFAVDSGITDTGIISMHHLQIIEENATSIIIGFTLVVLIMSLFVCCACVLPAGKVISKSHDEEDSPPGPEQGSPTSGNDADSEAEVNDNDEGRAKDSTGLRQRKVTSTGSKLSPAGKKKPRKDD